MDRTFPNLNILSVNFGKIEIHYNSTPDQIPGNPGTPEGPQELNLTFNVDAPDIVPDSGSVLRVDVKVEARNVTERETLTVVIDTTPSKGPLEIQGNSPTQQIQLSPNSYMASSAVWFLDIKSPTSADQYVKFDISIYRDYGGQDLERLFYQQYSVSNYCLDTDGDGLPDLWEIYGADVDNDGIIDLPLNK